MPISRLTPTAIPPSSSSLPVKRTRLCDALESTCRRSLETPFASTPVMARLTCPETESSTASAAIGKPRAVDAAPPPPPSALRCVARAGHHPHRRACGGKLEVTGLHARQSPRRHPRPPCPQRLQARTQGRFHAKTAPRSVDPCRTAWQSLPCIAPAPTGIGFNPESVIGFAGMRRRTKERIDGDGLMPRRSRSFAGSHGRRFPRRGGGPSRVPARAVLLLLVMVAALAPRAFAQTTPSPARWTSPGTGAANWLRLGVATTSLVDKLMLQQSVTMTATGGTDWGPRWDFRLSLDDGDSAVPIYRVSDTQVRRSFCRILIIISDVDEFRSDASHDRQRRGRHQSYVELLAPVRSLGAVMTEWVSSCNAHDAGPHARRDFGERPGFRR